MSFIPTDSELIPSGRLSDVKNTPFDFSVLREIGERIEEKNEQLKNGGGYDHCFTVDGAKTGEYYGKAVRFGAKLESSESGISMETITTEPGFSCTRQTD